MFLFCLGTGENVDTTIATFLATSAGSSMAPVPTSPHMRRLEIGPTHSAPKDRTSRRFSLVAGWAHILVFMLGHTTRGLGFSPARWASSDARQGQASRAHVSRLSHCPWASLDRVRQSAGATTNTSAHLVNSEVEVRKHHSSN